MSELSEALGRERVLTFDGKEFAVKPLNFNSLAVIEEKFGSLDALTFEKAADQRFLLWVLLSASDPSLTETAVGEMLTFEKLSEVVEFITAALRLSGLISKDGGGAEPKNSPARKAKA